MNFRYFVLSIMVGLKLFLYILGLAFLDMKDIVMPAYAYDRIRHCGYFFKYLVSYK